jgi:hypothetical protein
MFTRFAGRLFFLLVVTVLPFVFLIRSSVYLHTRYHLYPALTLAGGYLLTVVLLLVYLLFLGTPVRKLRSRWMIAGFLLLVYCAYALSFISGQNIQSGEIASEYRSLHPVLRLGICTILLIDKDLVVTDAHRVPDDYRKMGLSVKEHSLHYPQRNGYVHAFDVRTRDRSLVRNVLLKWAFRAMGFTVLRHGGTGDHLHISLRSHDRFHGS